MTVRPGDAELERARRGPLALLRRLVIFLLVLYAGWCAVLRFKQTELIYPRHLAGPALPEKALPTGVERVWIETEERGEPVRVEAWLFPPKVAPAPDAQTGVPAPSAPLVVYFHGNSELIDHNELAVEAYRARGFAALLVEYRGYGRSGGSPSQARIVEDSVRFIDLVSARPEIDPARLVYHGRSLGSGFAAQVTVRRPPRALVLESPFTSVAAFAARFGVPGFLVGSPLRTDRALAGMKDRPPTLILASRDDEIVPFSHGQRLHRLLPGSVFHEMSGSHVAAIADVPGVWDVIDRFLRSAGALP
ncbi:MAG TPA: alpha/beta hydrolase [Phycisphaerales bacterium]|nr:alpha/beta hydrolase [Phycisphaerales bacterium]